MMSSTSSQSFCLCFALCCCPLPASLLSLPGLHVPLKQERHDQMVIASCVGQPPLAMPPKPNALPLPAAESQTTLHYIPLTIRKQEPSSLVSVYTHQCSSTHIYINTCMQVLHVRNIHIYRVHVKTFGDRSWFRKTVCCTFSRSWVAVHCLAKRCPSECLLVM